MLPSIPYNRRSSTRRTQEIVAFRGMNRTQNTQDGDLCDATNLSTAEYPTVTQRGKRTLVHKTVTPEITEYSDPTDIYAWDGHLVVVDGGLLYYDGVAKDNVLPGKKQFAVVNTKLCIWPDKTYIDLTNGVYGPLAQSVVTDSSGTVIITGNSFTASPSAVHASNVTGSMMQTQSIVIADWEHWWTIYSFGTDQTAVAECWNGSSWTFPAGMKTLRGASQLCGRQSLTYITVGEIFIPSKLNNAFDYVTGVGSRGGPYGTTTYGYPDETKYNSEGYYAVVTSIYKDGPTGYSWYSDQITFDVYKVGEIAPLFSGLFHVGNFVNFSNLPGGMNVSHAAIVDIDDNNHKLTFANNTFSTTGSFTNIEVTISQDIPDLDYICEKDNRLWGVSNSQRNSIYNPDSQSYDTFTSRAIYASALGDPTAWWTFDGIDSDSFQVAVGSEGDFTGICAYGNAVCCWKEDALHKILGSYPSEYYIHTSHIEGVANGSSRSLTVVNETLYYNGATGIYAYTGSTPSLIGYPLGTLYKNVSAGSNGLRWYFSGTKPDGAKELVVYDLTHRIWTREDDSDAVAFAMIGSNLYILNHYDDTFNRIWMVEQGGDPDVEWSAEFVPFDETALIRKHYLRIALRLDMAAGSHVTVEVSMDNGDWRTLLNEDAVAAKAKVVQIPPNRVDRFTVRVSGTGNVRIREFMREFIPGSERP